jgi:hypothetical protein
MLSILFILFIFFRPLGKKEILIFLVSNIIFVLSDIGAVQNGFFKFAQPDYFGLPAWEFVAWGFWILFGYKVLPKQFPTNVDFRALLLAIIFSQSFAVIQHKESLLMFTLFIVFASLFIFSTIYDFYYVAFVAFVGLAVETVGLHFDLWSYPESGFIIARIQFFVMWAGIGLFFRNLVGPFLKTSILERKNFRNVFVPLDNHGIEQRSLAGLRGLSYSFTDLMQMSAQALAQSNTRLAIECVREALESAQTPFERAQAHLSLSQNYRMIIQIRNARKEIELAFAELKMEIPRNYFLQTVKALVGFLKARFMPLAPLDEPEIARFKVALYLEIGLAGYYLREDALMVQASLRAYIYSKYAGPSIDRIDWIGGTICLLTLKKWTRWIPSLMQEGEEILRKTQSPEIIGKWNIWMALAEDYSGNSKKSAESFTKILEQSRNHLKPVDLQLSGLTLSCNFLLRGHFNKAIQSIESLLDSSRPQESHLFSHTRTYIEICGLGSLGFLKSSDHYQDLIRISKAIFSQTDHEKWVITQYLGNRLFILYCEGSHDIELTAEIETRFNSLELKPQKTFLEACYFWIALSLVKLEQFSRGQVSKKQIRALLKKNKKLQDHPILKQHIFILEQRFSILCHQAVDFKETKDFEAELKLTENLLGFQEYQRNKLMMSLLKSDSNSSHLEIENQYKKSNWQQYDQMNINWIRSFGKLNISERGSYAD